MKKKMKHTIYSLLLPALLLCAASCSDNTDPELEPVMTARSLEVKVESASFSSGRLSMGAAPAEVEVKVTSNTRWSAEVTDCDGGWCSLNSLAGVSGTGDGAFRIEVLDNITAQRSCTVKIFKTDASGKRELDGSVDIRVEQVASDVSMSPSSLEPFNALSPAPVQFSIASNVEWTLTVEYPQGTTSFVSITPGEGISASGAGWKGSGDATFTVALADNVSSAARSATLHLKSAISDFKVDLLQSPDFGAQAPAVSEPWLSDGYSQTSATVNFQYYSPFVVIRSAAVEWRPAGETVWSVAEATGADAHSGLVSVTLTGLDPATAYEARGVVISEEGTAYSGSVGIPFTTAGKRPDQGDNPPPGN